jgi:hypothetical protein
MVEGTGKMDLEPERKRKIMSTKAYENFKLPGIEAARQIRKEQGTVSPKNISEITLQAELIDEDDGFLEAILAARKTDAAIRSK